MGTKKFTLSNISKPYGDKLVYRIIANETFGDVYEGTLGGYVEHEYNLSHEGNCWIYDNAIVAENATVSGNATLHDNAIVTENASIYGDAKLYNNVIVTGKSKVFECARLYDNAYVTSRASIYGSARISGRSYISGNAKIYGYTEIEGRTTVTEDAEVFGYNITINGISKIYENAIVYGNNIKFMFGEYNISNNAYISDLNDVFYISDDFKYSSDFTDFSITCYKTKYGYGIVFNNTYFNDINTFKNVLYKSDHNYKKILSKKEIDALIEYMKLKIARKFYESKNKLPEELK